MLRKKETPKSIKDLPMPQQDFASKTADLVFEFMPFAH